MERLLLTILVLAPPAVQCNFMEKGSCIVLMLLNSFPVWYMNPIT